MRVRVLYPCMHRAPSPAACWPSCAACPPLSCTQPASCWWCWSCKPPPRCMSARGCCCSCCGHLPRPPSPSRTARCCSSCWAWCCRYRCSNCRVPPVGRGHGLVSAARAASVCCCRSHSCQGGGPPGACCAVEAPLLTRFSSCLSADPVLLSSLCSPVFLQSSRPPCLGCAVAHPLAQSPLRHQARALRRSFAVRTLR